MPQQAVRPKVLELQLVLQGADRSKSLAAEVPVVEMDSETEAQEQEEEPTRPQRLECRSMAASAALAGPLQALRLSVLSAQSL